MRPGPCPTIASMSVPSSGRAPARLTPIWVRASARPAVAGSPSRPELAALDAGLPSVEGLFDFMRDAELRFHTLRMRLEERTTTARGDGVVVSEVTLRHPGEVKILTSVPAEGTTGNYEVWISDGQTVRTFVASRRVGTRRPVRARVRGLDSEGVPDRSRVYQPRTVLPMETLPELFIHPAGYCQNVLATGACEVTGTTDVAGREAVVLESAHPRTIEIVADREDFRVRIAVDRRDGVILRLEESMGGVVTRDAVVTSYLPDVALPPGAFDFTFPPDTVFVY